MLEFESFNPWVATGCLLVAGAVMYWAGWVFLPHKVGKYFSEADFPKVRECLALWVWVYRICLFGQVILAMALAALAVMFLASPARVLVVPGAAVAAVGIFVGSLAHAFYYHYGAWGAQETEGFSREERERYARSIKPLNEYMTCWTRFGRVFFGLGATALACGLVVDGSLPGWISWSLLILGLAPMVVTMAFPDRLKLYRPVFHLLQMWFLAVGSYLCFGSL